MFFHNLKPQIGFARRNYANGKDKKIVVLSQKFRFPRILKF